MNNMPEFEQLVLFLQSEQGEAAVLALIVLITTAIISRGIKRARVADKLQRQSPTEVQVEAPEAPAKAVQVSQSQTVERGETESGEIDSTDVGREGSQVCEPERLDAAIEVTAEDPTSLIGATTAPAEEIVEEPQLTQPSTTINTGLKKSRTSLFGRLREVFSRSSSIEPMLVELEEILIGSDLGVKASSQLVQRLREHGKQIGKVTEDDLRSELRSYLLQMLGADQGLQIEPTKVGNLPKVILVVGVNGVGKTTTIGKLATKFRAQGATVVVGACDTFRAAAVDQLQIWADRAGVEIVSGPVEAKPTTVAYQAVKRAMESNADVLIIDTAGRLHTRVNLMNELGSVVGIIERELPGAPHETILVVDAATGQNALQQAREFNARAKLSGIVVTKLDGTPKGGIVVAIRDELGVPIRYVGVGEGADDLKVFDANDFIEALLAPIEDSQEKCVNAQLSARGQIRRRRREDGVGNG